ncbi:site-specific integrase [Waterburya agarophytonicola K14]|uniref:Site-specific integrase n=1 Tax=Waterburya agarophytonicola KI4 TaxID=2874699 RepID=A0A964BTU7_9CYAN|nr:hypothetical protein [Waterburya agarophytonicola]MCC0178746.1 site-specific integrase [Waterburya agarophytonicola KI4]
MKVNWSKDYQREFVCPHCKTKGLNLNGNSTNKNRRLFRCPQCRKVTSNKIKLKFPNARTGINWNRDYKIGEFVCPNSDCNSRDIRLHNQPHGKQRFRCNVCGTETFDFIKITPKNLSQYAHKRPIKPFSFQDNQWDIRAIKPPANEQEQILIANFETVERGWFRKLVKHYIYHLCQLDKSISTLTHHLSNLRIFSQYLAKKKIYGINLIDRSLILDFLTWDKTGISGTRARLSTLRNFFEIGNIKNWFVVDPHLIRDDDFPKSKVSNPDPLPDSVREQIESIKPLKDYRSSTLKSIFIL